MVSTAPTGPQFLAEQLERLLAMPLETTDDVLSWRREADTVQSACDRFPGFEFPHHIWHYFLDADVRHRDFEYREYQEKQIRDYIADVRATPTI